MSPVLKVDGLEDMPDEIQPIDAGVYVGTISQVPEVADARSGKGKVLRVSVQITGDADGNECEASRQNALVFDSIPIWTRRGKIKIKRLQKSAGLTPTSELDLEELVGKDVKVKVTQRTYEDDEGEEQTANNLREYMIPE